MSDNTKTKQFVTNVTEETKAMINDLKTELNLGDKGVVHVLLELAKLHRHTTDAAGIVTDNLKVLAEKFGQVKAKVEKAVLTEEEKVKLAIEKQLAKLAEKLRKFEHPDEVVEEAGTQIPTPDTSELSTNPEPEPVVVIGV